MKWEKQTFTVCLRQHNYEYCLIWHSHGSRWSPSTCGLTNTPPGFAILSHLKTRAPQREEATMKSPKELGAPDVQDTDIQSMEWPQNEQCSSGRICLWYSPLCLLTCYFKSNMFMIKELSIQYTSIQTLDMTTDYHSICNLIWFDVVSLFIHMYADSSCWTDVDDQQSICLPPTGLTASFPHFPCEEPLKIESGTAAQT